MYGYTGIYVSRYYAKSGGSMQKLGIEYRLVLKVFPKIKQKYDCNYLSSSVKFVKNSLLRF